MQLKILTILFFLTIISACKYSNNNEIERINYFCGAENTTPNNKYFIEQNNSNVKFANNNIQSFEKSFSGKYSVKLDSIHKFGMSIKIKNIKPDEKYKISVVRYGNPKAYIIVSSGKGLYEKIGIKSEETNKNGWHFIEKVIKTPFYLDKDELNIYLWNTTNEIAYFDELKIEHLPKYSNYNLAQTPLYIYIDEQDMNKLEEIKKDAFRKGILETTDDSWVKASMFYKSEDYKTKLRFKGDWLDHLQGIKWSFRIKVKKGKTWKGMKTFSIQNPNSRNFLHEWFAHKIFESEDVLTTRYGFVPVYLNNKPLGLYAYEDHFEKQLVEAKKRREGVILKFSEDQFWATYNVTKNTDVMPVYEASDIMPFKQTKTIESVTLFNQFRIAQSLLYQYKNQLNKVSDIFDVKQLAKYYAIISLTKMNHSLRWHNQRYYYNPILSKLEIIAFDGYVPDSFMAWGGSIFGNFEIATAKKCKIENRSNYYIFTDSIFLKEYVKQLEIYSSSKFLNKCFENNKEQIEFLEGEIQKEFINYKYDTTFLYKNAESIRKDLNIYKLRIKEGKYKNFKFNKGIKTRYITSSVNKLNHYFVNSYLEEDIIGNKIIKIENYLPSEILVLGFSKSNLFISGKISPIAIGKFRSTTNYKYVNTSIKHPNYVFCKLLNSDSIFSVEIFPWNSPSKQTPLQSIITENPIENLSYKISKNKIIFKKGKHIIKRSIIIPANFEVLFEAGAELDFIDSAIFLSFSNIQMVGTKKDKIIIKSSDNSAQGFTIMQASNKSNINNVIFDGFNTLNYKNWILTGAINFYESDVSISNTLFKNNFCEDALNIIRSDFKLDNCHFENILSDAFDSDFSYGMLKGTSFNKIGNDAIDFSGSEVDIENCNILNVGDKGISGGENSILSVKNTFISDAKIAIASKDKSLVTISDSRIENCYYGFVVLQKKPEFGSAVLKTSNVIFSNLINIHLIEKKSKLYLDNKLIIGYDKNTAKKFYK